MRLFVAILLDDAIKAALRRVQSTLRKNGDPVRWLAPEQMHMTVKFLGEVVDRDVPAVCEAAGRAARAAGPVELRLSQCGCFPPRGPVRIVWAGGQIEDDALRPHVAALETEMESLGFPREARPFSAHVTLGRVRSDRSGGRLRAAVTSHRMGPLTQHITSLRVMSSVLSRHGPTYTPISTAAFDRPTT